MEKLGENGRFGSHWEEQGCGYRAKETKSGLSNPFYSTEGLNWRGLCSVAGYPGYLLFGNSFGQINMQIINDKIAINIEIYHIS